MNSDSNSKLLLIGGAAVALVVVAVGVRTLTSTDPREETRKTEVTKPAATTDDDTDDTKSGGSGKSKVTSMGSSAKSSGSGATVKSAGPKAGSSNFSGFKYDETASTAPATQIASAVTPAAGATPAAEDTEEAKANARKISDLTSLFKNEKDPSARIDLADELGLIDDPASIRRLLELAQTETDPEVKEALINALTGLDALETVGKEAVQQIDQLYRTSGELDVRIAAMDALGDIATADSLAALQQMYKDAAADPAERLNAAENIMRIRTNEPSLLPADQAAAINEQLKIEFQAGTDPAFRSQAAMALALMGKENQPFFQQALTTEQDPNVKNLLERLSKMQFGPQ